ncbi:MAG: hypothetical protein H6708_21755 [Kofleriaceae bacterium]|nr:hypothetical protein [Myxococcales bacterium]MCB9563040.1 hypothetical protein [Kofleriaceae bacterium]
MRFVIVALLGLAAVGRPVQADGCQFDWYTSAGTVSPGAVCRAVVLTTDAAGADHAEGSAVFASEVAGRGTLAVTLRALSPWAGPLQIQFPGGWVLLRDDAIGLYTSEAQWGSRGWQPLPSGVEARRLVDERRLELDLRGDGVVVVRLAGVEAARWSLDTPARGVFAVWLHGPRGRRARVAISDWSLPPAE